MKSINLFALAICLMFTVTGSSQEITWGDKVPNLSYGPFKLVQLKDNNFFTITQKSGFSDKECLHYYENFVLKSENQLKIEYNDTSYRYFDSKIVNEKFYIFSKNLSYYHGRLLVQEYDENCLPSGVPKELMTLEESDATRYEFLVKESENKEFIVVLSKVYGAHNNNPHLIYKVFTKNFDVVHEGKYTFPKKDRWGGFYSNELLTNTGDLFFVVEQDTSTTQGKLFSFFRANRFELKECPVRMSYDFVSKLGLVESENHQLLCTGLFGLQPKSVDGIFSCEIDFDLSVKKNESSVPLVEDYLFDKTSRQLGAYNFLEVVRTDQGFFVLVEQTSGSTGGVSYTAPSETITSSANVSSNSTQLSMGTVSSTVPLGYWNYLILYRINNTGIIDWHNKIEKNQIGGYESRYTSCIGNVEGDKYILYFNDNVKNYDSEGSFTGDVKKNSVYETSIDSDGKDVKNNTLVRVVIDLSSGNYERKSFITGEKSGMAASPKNFIFNNVKREFLIYFQVDKEAQFGILKI